MALFYVPDIDVTWELPEDEAAHCLRVLRLGVGSNVDITDGKGNFYKAEISEIAGKRCRVVAKETIPMPKGWLGRLHIAIAPTKNIDRIEWMIEKAVEIGVDEVTFLNCRFSERKTVKDERMERIAVSAMKQSLKPYAATLHGMVDFARFVNTARGGAKFIAHCYDGDKSAFKNALVRGEDVTVLVGPEGDFSPEEVQMAVEAGYRPVSLGNSRLRTETAGLVVCHTFNIVNEE